MFSHALVLTQECPYPSNSGTKIREARIIQLLLEKMEVELVCFPSDQPSQLAGKDEQGVPPTLKLTLIERRKEPIWRRAIHRLNINQPSGNYSDAIAKVLRSRAEKGKLLWISRFAMAQYLPLARSLGYRVVLDEYQVESSLMLDGAFSRMSGNPLESLRALPSLFAAAQTRYFEGEFCTQSDAIIAASDLDATRLHRIAPSARVHVVPNSVDCSQYKALRKQSGQTLFFSGSLNWRQNVEGLSWFISEVLPRIRAHLGAAAPRIVVAGSDPSPSVAALLQGAGVELYPNPPSMLPFLGEAAVVFVPMRSGSGTRTKILEAMAAGRAVVSTGKGAEGLVLAPSYDIWVADRPDAFASAICRLIENPQLRLDFGMNAARTVDERYHSDRARIAIQQVLSALIAPATGGGTQTRVD